MKYIRKFANRTEYNNYINGQHVAYPNISICEANYTVHSSNTDEIVDPDNPIDYSQIPLTFKILSDGYICFTCDDTGNTKTIQYSINGGAWTNLTSTLNKMVSTSITVQGKEGTYTYGGYYANNGSYYWEQGSDKLYYDLPNVEADITLTGACLINLSGSRSYDVLTTVDEFVGTKIYVNTGDIISFKGNNSSYSGNLFSNTFKKTNCNFNVYGNIMSLISGDNFSTLTTLTGTYNFKSLFNSLNIINAKNLILPATTLTNYCYEEIFNRCENLITAPELPATTLANYCYEGMFSGCTSLTVAPELPVETLTTGCYYRMFYYCNSLLRAPSLRASILPEFCYYNMFYHCVSLNYILCAASNISATGCLNNWVNGVASSGTFEHLQSTNWPTGTNGIPSGWTVNTFSGLIYEDD